MRGIVDRIYLKYFPIVGCTSYVTGGDIAALEQEPNATAARRRLEYAGRRRARTSTGAACGDNNDEDEDPLAAHRQLRGGSASAAAAGGASTNLHSALSASGTRQIDNHDFMGLFLLWAVTTAVLVTWTYTNELCRCCRRGSATLRKSATLKRATSGFGATDNEAKMLRKLASQMNELQKRLAAAQGPDPFVASSAESPQVLEVAATVHSRAETTASDVEVAPGVVEIAAPSVRVVKGGVGV